MQKNKPGKSNQLRIIGGMFRSRKLTFPTLPGLRPTGDRIRETLFNWLTPYVVDSLCLDMFAGSGALGIEALSRGAAHVTFIDASPQACEALRRNLNLLDGNLLASGKARVICTNSLPWLDKQGEKTETGFDIVFLDPPFSANLLQACCDSLKNGNGITKNALIYVEGPRENNAFSIPTNWQLQKDRNTGSVHYQLFQRN